MTKKIKPSSSPRKTQVNIRRAEHFSGPIPPPEILERYNTVYPGAAQIILEAFKVQGDHRRSLETMVVKQGKRDSLLGLVFAFILGLATVTGSVICIIYDHQIAGTLLGGAGLTSLVGTFVYGTRSRRHEREAKARMFSR
jgi:uncharacterized membrane protein